MVCSWPAPPGVVTAVVFSSLCVLAVMSRFLYQHRQAQRAASLQEKETQRRLEAAYHAELHLHTSTLHNSTLHNPTLHNPTLHMRDSLREYYI